MIENSYNKEEGEMFNLMKEEREKELHKLEEVLNDKKNFLIFRQTKKPETSKLEICIECPKCGKSEIEEFSKFYDLFIYNWIKNCGKLNKLIDEYNSKYICICKKCGKKFVINITIKYEFKREELEIEQD